MLTVYLGIAMLVLVAVTGGSLARLATIQIRHVWLLWAALADQILVISVLPDSNATVLAIAHVASYVAAGAWLVANRRLPGGRLIGLGGALNGLVISLNGGTLPASESAVRAAGQVAEAGQFTNSEVLADPKLAWLGDVFATPTWVPGNNVFSVGDVAIWLGLMILLWRTCKAIARPLPRHASWAPAGYERRHAARGGTAAFARDVASRIPRTPVASRA
ncbi:MAG TPA: DUF5317 domain-containing protein [Actinoplanes sp.]